ncbi:RNA polymerase subunit sigma [Sporosarcina sp. E16_8]|uniref:RNA polymerase subunit sigma n=1 Tax=Sporosarcina sp. E16_8 TaxID=2789295 RepID=UPI001A932A3F|nr:RNA polymerase subunit sigma [Sporosarcina sp. E16_8]MBO0585758.1 RNA polymerase subunit sigma [Sporosarcina sp. E16_8]
MSLKGIELQIAIPKTFEAGKIAEQKHQQTQLNLDHANSLMERQALKAKETVLESEEAAKAANGHPREQEQGELQNGDHQQNEEEKKTVHPYKGAFVDFTG